MEINPQILIFAVSLAAIFALAGLAALMRLGGKPALESEWDAARAANDVLDGFEPSEIAVDRGGAAAILCDASGQVMLIKCHGNHFAGRILTPAAKAEASGEKLTIASGEARYGSVSLIHPDAASWAETINRLERRHDA